MSPTAHAAFPVSPRVAWAARASRGLATWALVVALGFAPGCASIGASAALDEAQATLDEARAAGADAPAGPAAYAWWSARGYLDAARTAQGHGDYDGATAFARRARDFAAQARAAAQPVAPGATPGSAP